MKIGSSLNPWNALHLDTLYFTNLTDLRVAVTYILKTWSRWSSSRPPTSSRRTTSARPWRRPHFWRQSKGEPDSSITQIQVRHLRTVTSFINVSSYKWIQTETKWYIFPLIFGVKLDFSSYSLLCSQLGRKADVFMYQKQKHSIKISIEIYFKLANMQIELNLS